MRIPIRPLFHGLAVSIVLVLCSSSAMAATPLGITAEGVFGIPLEPGAGFWDYRTPTSLLGRKQFIVSVSGQVSDLLNRRYRTGRADDGYAIGVGGGAVAGWQYGVTGIWALGSGQSQDWSHPTGLYSLTPSPKIGVMALSHAWRHGQWGLGGTLYRTSFSLSDTFTFNRYPTSSNAQISRYFYSLLPEAIGNSITYDALGNRIALFMDAERKTPIGAFGVVLSAWSASADWLTQHTNSISDAHDNRAYLAGTKNGGGHGGWHGSTAEGRWSGRIARGFRIETRFARGVWSGDASMWLRNPARAPTQDGRSNYEIEPRDWGNDSVKTDSWRTSFAATWKHSDATALRFDFVWENHDLWTSGYGRTPVLTLDVADKGSGPVQQAAAFGVTGSLDVLGMNVSLSHRPVNGRWAWCGDVGVVQLDGWADTEVVPHTVGFRKNRSSHTWKWTAVRLAYAEISASRQMTQQIALTYSFRQYLPLSASWKRDDAPALTPGGVSGIRFGSMHQIRVAMRL